MSKVLAVDLGASNGRVILGNFNNEKLDIEVIHRFANNIIFEKDKLFWDINNLFYEIKKGLKIAFQKYDDIQSIAIDTWGVDYGLLDRKGNLLNKPYSYRDKRTDSIQEKVYKKISPQELYKITGIQNMKINTIFQLCSELINNKEALEEVKYLLFIPDLINYFLTGEKFNEYTLASTSGLLNVINKSWDKKTLKKLNIPEEILCNIIYPGQLIGKVKKELADELSIPRIKVITVGSHDTQSVSVSVPINKNNNSIYISSGTWSIIGETRDCPLINDKTYKYGFSNEGGCFNSYNLLKNVTGMWILQECLKEWNKIEKYDYDTLEKLAQNAEDLETLIDFDNDLFIQPGNMLKKIEAYCKKLNKKTPETIGQTVKVIYRSIAHKYKEAICEIEEINNKQINVIHMVGGGSQSKLMCQMTADMTKKEVMSGPVEAAAIGNILVQLIAIGKIKNSNEANRIIRNSFEIKNYKSRKNYC